MKAETQRQHRKAHGRRPRLCTCLYSPGQLTDATRAGQLTSIRICCKVGFRRLRNPHSVPGRIKGDRYAGPVGCLASTVCNSYAWQIDARVVLVRSLPPALPPPCWGGNVDGGVSCFIALCPVLMRQCLTEPGARLAAKPSDSPAPVSHSHGHRHAQAL